MRERQILKVLSKKASFDSKVSISLVSEPNDQLIGWQILTLIRYLHARRQMVKVQWADGWMKGGEAVITLTHWFPLKEEKPILHKQGTLFWRPQSLLQLFCVCVKKPHTSEIYLAYKRCLSHQHTLFGAMVPNIVHQMFSYCHTGSVCQTSAALGDVGLC